MDQMTSTDEAQSTTQPSPQPNPRPAQRKQRKRGTTKGNPRPPVMGSKGSVDELTKDSLPPLLDLNRGPYSGVKQVYRYPFGLLSHEPELPLWSQHLKAFLKAPSKDTLSKFDHARKVVELVWPETGGPKGWNPWLERCLKAFTNEEYAVNRRGTVVRTIVLTGCATAGKTFAAGLYSVLWWMAAPEKSIAYFTSTSRPMVRRRIWPIIQRFGSGGVINHKTGEKAAFGGNMVDSKTTLQFQKGDDKHSISALAVAQGDTAEAVAKLSGQHAERILLVIDEGQATPEAIYATIPNLRKACRDLTIIVIENPAGKLTGSGRAAEPEKGWNSIGLQSDEWRTKGVPDWQLEPGVALRFDGATSPNVILGEDRWPFLYTTADWEAAQAPGRQGTLAYWIQDRGIHPPDGTCKTVFSEQLVVTHGGYDKFTFATRKRVLGALDPAFGGDGCVLRFGEIGDILSEKTGLPAGFEGIQLTEVIEIPLDPESGVPVEKQIALATMGHCLKRGVKPEDFGTDTTGIGRGVAYALSEEWSPRIRRIEFGGLASDLPAGADDPRPAKEVYDRRVTELWWAVREFLTAGQLKGFDTQTVIEFCTREYEHTGKKNKIEKKEDMKAKMGYSPDRADACAVLIEVARQQGFELQSGVTRKADLEAQREVGRVAEGEELEADLSGLWEGDGVANTRDISLGSTGDLMTIWE